MLISNKKIDIISNKNNNNRIKITMCERRLERERERSLRNRGDSL